MYLRIVETQSGSPGLSQDLVWDCNLDIRFPDSSTRAFAITSLGALFAVATLLYWSMRFMLLHTCTLGKLACQPLPGAGMNTRPREGLEDLVVGITPRFGVATSS